MKILISILQFVKISVAILGFSFLINCGLPNVDIEQMPKPPNSTVGLKYPEFKTKLETSTNLYLGELKKKHSFAKSIFFTYEKNSDWKELVGFYDSKLADKGFKRISEIPEKIDASEHVMYEKKGVLGVNQTLIFSLIEVANDQNETKYQFLFIGSGK